MTESSDRGKMVKTIVNFLQDAEQRLDEIETKETLYDFVTSWLREKGCKFVDHGGWGVTESTDSVYVLDEDKDWEPEIVVSLSQKDGGIGLSVRLWHKQISNIESRSEVKIYSEKEAVVVLAALYECLCQVNELVSRLREDED